ncbi:MAG: 4-hydroxy-tetrahydrodipicolinate synthase [Candidatus Bathyarchaeota archaeon]|nr:4-hydroxy-tetrahydrodipicolinate synthase [Candidatus Bathyarchaeota archaeon]
MRDKLRGIIPALITPFTSKNEVNKYSLLETVNFIIERGVHGVLVIGGTGEFVSLSDTERKEVIDIVIDEVNGRLPVIVGSLSPGINDSIKLALYARNAGADAVLQITPYYVRAVKQGLYEYYKTIAENVEIPIILYNIPYRTGVNLSPSLISKLAENDNIVGVKQCNRDMSETFQLNELVSNKFSILCGEDDLTIPLLMLHLCSGGILASANLVPRIWVQVFEACEKGDVDEAKEIFFKLMPLIKALFAETNPGPLKEALEMRQIHGGPVRRPLLPVKEETKRKLRAAMEDLLARTEFTHAP